MGTVWPGGEPQVRACALECHERGWRQPDEHDVRASCDGERFVADRRWPDRQVRDECEVRWGDPSTADQGGGVGPGCGSGQVGQAVRVASGAAVGVVRGARVERLPLGGFPEAAACRLGGEPLAAGGGGFCAEGDRDWWVCQVEEFDERGSHSGRGRHGGTFHLRGLLCRELPPGKATRIWWLPMSRLSRMELPPVTCQPAESWLSTVTDASAGLGRWSIVKLVGFPRREGVAAVVSMLRTRWASDLGVAGVSRKEVHAAMDWLGKRQDAIEAELARRHLSEGGMAMFDLSSSWMEGSCCELAARGYSRDGKRGKLQIEYGLLTDRQGRPVAIRVFVR
jgi:hypothetical protein